MGWESLSVSYIMLVCANVTQLEESPFFASQTERGGGG